MEIQKLLLEYEHFKKCNLSINMERGWPCTEQLQLSMPMLDMVTSQTELCHEVDYRSYAGAAGITPIKELFAEILDVMPEEIYVGGTMSTTIMYDLISRAIQFGFPGSNPWKNSEKIKMICPSPGYEKHFNICSTFGIEMIPVPILEDGPDMDVIEKLVLLDKDIKGIWCVPLYSNPTGTIYSDETVSRLARMKTEAIDFKIIWDNAYCVHHLTEEKVIVKNILKECEKWGNPDRVFEFTSTSKITFPGGGIGICASSKENIKWLTKSSLLQLKTGDKINQLRHALFLKDLSSVHNHMKKHREIIKPKFDLIDRMLNEAFEKDSIVKWKNPKGGYFITLELLPRMASKTCILCKEAGVSITPAGSIFPYGIDPEDKYLRLAPTYPKISELKTVMSVLILSIKIAYHEIYTEE